MHHAVLAQISLCYSPLQGRLLTRYSPVRHFPLLQLAEASIQGFSFDLHVLSTPPAFILSQDQTLNEWYLNNLSVAQIIIIETNLSFKIELNRSPSQTSHSTFMKDYLCPSGALFVSRCLIYKVHAASCGGFIS